MNPKKADEIYKHSNDLCISLPMMDRQYGILITRGPDGYFEHLFMSTPKFTKEKAIDIIRSILTIVHNERSKNQMAWEKENVLTEERIKEIVRSLKEKGAAETFEAVV